MALGLHSCKSESSSAALAPSQSTYAYSSQFGVITIGLGIIAAFLIVDFPDKNKFLTEEQTKLMVERVQLDRGDAEPDHLTVKKFFKHFTDPKVSVFGLCFCFSTMPAYAFSCK